MPLVLDSLKVKAFAQDRMPNPYPAGDLPWQIYHEVRNSIVRTSRMFGPAGPMGIVTISSDVDDPYLALMRDITFWERGDPDPKYYIIPDQYNHERYCYAELYGENPLTPEWMLAIADVLRGHNGWGLGLTNIPGSYLFILGEGLLVNGRLAKCRTASEVVAKGARLLREGDKRWWEFWR